LGIGDRFDPDDEAKKEGEPVKTASSDFQTPSGADLGKWEKDC
jgi:hypothetical protein